MFHRFSNAVISGTKYYHHVLIDNKLAKMLKVFSHHDEGVADPQAAPSGRTLRDGGVLAVNRDGDRRGFANRAAADVGFDVSLLHRHHGERSGSGQPEGLVVSAGVVADVSGVAVQEGHGVEAGEAGAGQTWKRQ